MQSLLAWSSPLPRFSPRRSRSTGRVFLQPPQFQARLKGGGEDIHVTVDLKKDSTETRSLSLRIMDANASCWSAATQHTAICADWCGLLASNTVAPSWRNGIFCVFCACNGVVCPSSKATLTSKVSHADFDAAAAALAHAFASGLQPPLVHLVRVLDGVSHNAEQAFINSGEPANKVLSWPQMASDDIGLASQ
jgi:hypothetical protein